MSAGGYVATVIAVSAIALVVDVATRPSGLVALGLSVLGMLVTFALEVPVTVKRRPRRRPPDAAASTVD